LERFPDSVIEFSAFENAVGYLRGRNALFGKSVTTRCFNHEVRRSSLEQLRRSMITITECAESMERIKAAWSNELALGRNSTTPIRGLNGSTTLGRFHADEHRTILQTMSAITTKDGSKTTHEAGHFAVEDCLDYISETCIASTAIVSHPKPSANIPGASHNSRVALWEFDDEGLMRRRLASINDAPITEKERRVLMPAS
jgi:hypothetical protein